MHEACREQTRREARPAARRRRGVATSLLALAVVSIVLFCRAQRVQSSFEEPLGPAWVGPHGGGSAGGSGCGEIVAAGPRDFVHEGDRSVRLTVWGDGRPEAVCWAGVISVVPCDGGCRVRAGTWLYFSSEVMPLCTGALAQLKIEYFEDEQAQQLVPRHIYISPPFDSQSYRPDAWHLVEAGDRAPARARSLKVSILMTAQRPGCRRQAVWMDDVFVEVQKPPPRGRGPASGP